MLAREHGSQRSMFRASIRRSIVRSLNLGWVETPKQRARENGGSSMEHSLLAHLLLVRKTPPRPYQTRPHLHHGEATLGIFWEIAIRVRPPNKSLGPPRLQVQARGKGLGPGTPSTSSYSLLCSISPVQLVDQDTGRITSFSQYPYLSFQFDHEAAQDRPLGVTLSMLVIEELIGCPSSPVAIFSSLILF